MLERAASTLRDALALLGRGTARRDDSAAAITRTLSPTVMQALDLRRQPFHDRATAHELFVDDTIRMQINMLHEQLRAGDVLPVLKGEAGSGKTCLLIQLMTQGGDDIHFFVARGEPGLRARRVIVDMLRMLVRPPPEDPAECFQDLARRLRALVADGCPAALVIDDAHHFSEHDLGDLLAARDSLDQALNGRFRLLLAADPSIELRLSALRSRQIDSGQVMASNVRPLSRLRIEPFLDHRLRAAGYFGMGAFDEDALDYIATESGGLPRSVEALAAAELEDRFGG